MIVLKWWQNIKIPFHFSQVISCPWYVIASAKWYIASVNCIRFHDFPNLYVICKDVPYVFTNVRFSPTSTALRSAFVLTDGYVQYTLRQLYVNIRKEFMIRHYSSCDNTNSYNYQVLVKKNGKISQQLILLVCCRQMYVILKFGKTFIFS
jgi:hypothetical protein